MKASSKFAKSVLCLFMLLSLLLPAVVQAGAAILYVDFKATGSNNGSNWLNAYTDLQSALTAAVSGNTIYVAQGTYKPAISERTATFQLKNGVTIQGGYQAGASGLRDTKIYITTLSGDLSGNDNSNIAYDEATRSDNSYHVVTGSGTDSTAILDGFTISGGNANNYNAVDSTGSFGAGMYNDAGSPTVEKVTFSNNSAMNYGAGMYNTGGSSPTIIDATFSSNYADSGGGMYNNASSPTVQNTTFSSNSTVSQGAGMYNYAGSPILQNVTFSNNLAGNGGGMFNNASSNPTLMNVTFSNNTASIGGGMYNLGSSSPTLTNCILWGDAQGEIFNDSATPTVAYSIVQGGYAGTANLNTDPFLGPLGSYGGYTQTHPLLPASSAINVGTATGAPSTDQRGIARPQGAGHDIGAFEADTTTAPQPTVTSITANSAYPVAPINVTINGTNFTDTPIVLFQKSGFANIAATNISLVNSGKLTCTLDITGAAPGTWSVVVLSQDGHSGALTNGFTVQDITHGNIYVNKNNSSGTYTGTSWATAFTDLAGVLASTLSGDTIYVAQGTYKPTTGTDRTKTFALKTGVNLLGGYSSDGTGTRNIALYTTILSGDIGTTGNTSDNSYHVVTGSGTDNTAVISGFTITRGNTGTSSGGGVFNNNGSPTVQDVVFSYNSAFQGGGMFNNSSSPTLTNVTFSNNSAYTGGGMYSSGGTQTLTNVAFSNNSASAGCGGLGSQFGTQTLTKVTFSGNSTEGSGGGMCIDFETQTLTNVTFAGNTASSYGGAIYTNDEKPSSSTLMNVTFSGNTATTSGGGIYHDASSTLTATNCILWGDTPNEIVNGGTATLAYNVVQGGFVGASNLSTDPKLGTLGNYGGYTQTIPLLAGSSAIDTGTTTDAPTTDQRGNARPQAGGYDIGAYEVAPPTISSISPTSGTTAGGTSVTITGTNLTGTTSVTIGGNAASSLSVVSATSITAVTPSGTAGAKNIVVTTHGGTGTGVGLFTYVVPVPTATTGAASGIGTGSATLNGTANANNASTAVTFQYGLTTGYGTTVNATQSPVTGSSNTAVSKAINGLSCGTTYHFRVVGTNSAGTTNGSDATFRTTTCPQPPPTYYYVTYNGNDNTGGTAPTDSNAYANGATVTVKANTGILTRTGYTFNGWNSAADGSGASYSASGSVTFSIGSANITLYAQWTLSPTYRVTYDGNYNSGGSAPADSNAYANGATVTVKANTGTLTRTGYTFNGWNSAANGSGTSYAASGSATFSIASASITLYAQWTVADTTGPTLNVSTLLDGLTTKYSTLNIEGTVSDSESGVKSVTVNANSLTIDSGKFSTALTLTDGANIITTVATDNADNTTTDRRIITLDQTAPGLTITLPADNSITNKTTVEITGTVDDATATITANRSTAGVTMNGNNFSVTLDLTSGLNTIDITATDPAGNSSSGKRSITSDSTIPSLAVSEPAQDITTRETSITISGTVTDTVTTATVSIKVDDQTFAPTVAENGSFSQNLTLSTDKTYNVIVTATDQAGNKATTVQRNIIKTSYPSGDINGDGVVDIADALRVLRIAVGLENATLDDYAKADVAPLVNGKPAPDGVIDIADATVILMKVVGVRSW